jgi:hypothetical protein
VGRVIGIRQSELNGSGDTANMLSDTLAVLENYLV